MYKYIHTCIYIHISCPHTYTHTHIYTRIQNVHMNARKARLKRRRGSDCAGSPTWHQEALPFSLSTSRQRAVQTTFAYLHWCGADPPGSLSTPAPSLAVAPRNEVSLNSKTNKNCRALLVATPSGRLPQKQFMKKDTGLGMKRFPCSCHLYFLCLSRKTFLATNSQKLFSLPQCACVTFLVNCDKLELAAWFSSSCSMHAIIQVPERWAAVVVSRNCRCHPIAVCTVDVTVSFNRQIVL